MPQTTYTYSIANDFPGGQVNVEKLQIAIQYSSIVTPLDGINTSGDEVDIVFSDVLSANDKATLDGNQSSPAGGLIATTSTTPFLDDTHRSGILGCLLAANMATTADQPIFMTTNKFVIRKIVAMNASGAILLATGGIYTGKSKGGNALVAATQVFTGLTAANKYVDLTLNGTSLTDVQTTQLLYLSLTTAMLSAGTCDIMIVGDDMSGIA
jgi:hypothetical protein